MDKRRNIKIIVSLVIVLAFAFQFIRLDSQFASNITNTNVKITADMVETHFLSERFASDDSFLVIYDSSDEVSEKVLKNIERVMKQLKKQYELEDVAIAKEVFCQQRACIVTVENLEKITNLGDLFSYLENGGKVAFLQTMDQNNGAISHYQDLGIVDSGINQFTEGISFDEKLVPGYKADAIQDIAVKNFSMPLTLDGNCQVYMKSDDNIPLLWAKDVNDGRCICFNGTMLQDKIMTGFITRMMALMNEDFIYPIINSKVIWLDDFPAPMTNRYYPEIKKLYNKTIKEFYFDVWWPEMLKVATKYDIKYTGVMIDTYNNKTKGPFSNAPGEIPDTEFVALGRELIRSGGELGLHGYNHQSLTMDYWKADELGYHKWKNERDMIESLKEVRAKLDRTFPDYEIRVYVPPSNVMDENGVKALKTVFPEISAVASVYYEDYEGLSYSQDFTYTPNQIINLPRFSAGYFFGGGNRLAVVNGILAFGAIQHFIHPDDFMDPERNEGKSWPEQLESYQAFAKLLDSHYPFIEADTGSKAAEKVARYVGLDYTVNYKPQGIEVVTNATSFPMDMFLHSEYPIASHENCTVDKIGENDYYIKFESEKFAVAFEKD